MRKLIIILLIDLLIGMTEASYAKDTTLPIEVVKLKNNNLFDTVLVIKTKENFYCFDYKTKQQIVLKEEKKSFDFGGIDFLFLLIFILILLFI